MNLKELQLWIDGFAAALGSKSSSTGTNSNVLTKEQWEMILTKIKSAQDASTQLATNAKTNKG